MEDPVVSAPPMSTSMIVPPVSDSPDSMSVDVSAERREVLERLAGVFDTGTLPGQVETAPPVHMGVRIDEATMERRLAQFSKGITSTVHRSSVKEGQGHPISLDKAKELRSIVFGTSIHPLSRDWAEGALQPAGPKFPFGLKAPRSGPKGLILCIQTYLLKSLLFKITYDRGCGSPLTEEDLSCSDEERRSALVEALSEVLCLAAPSSSSSSLLGDSESGGGGAESAVSVCVLGGRPYFESMSGYRSDGITERINVIQMRRRVDLKQFLNKHLSEFTKEGSPGCLLLLYSLVLTKGIDRLRQELGECKCVLGDYEEVSFTTINLLLTGRAVPYFHNGLIRYAGPNQEQLLEVPHRGAARRSQIGVLYWCRERETKDWPTIGSMLKTPLYPIWLVVISGRPTGVLFSLKAGLVNDWRVENLFSLYYYAGGTEVITRANAVDMDRVASSVAARQSGNGGRGVVIPPPAPRYCRLDVNVRLSRVWPKSKLMREEAERRLPVVEHLVLTKWADADIQWNCRPFI